MLNPKEVIINIIKKEIKNINNIKNDKKTSEKKIDIDRLLCENDHLKEVIS